ncbi:MAG: LysE family transporter [Bacteroidota bacterium]
MKQLKVLGAGLLISWLGALPLGTLNVTAFDIAATKGFQAAFLFAVAAISVELFYVRLSLWGNKKWTLNDQWISPLLLLGVIFLFYLSLKNFSAPVMTTNFSDDGQLYDVIESPLLLGFLLSALNPLQFPFWLTWNKVLSKKNILKNEIPSQMYYMLGIGLGTFLALSLFIWMGGSLLLDYQVYGQFSHKILGVLYLGYSLYLLFMF